MEVILPHLGQNQLFNLVLEAQDVTMDYLKVINKKKLVIERTW